MFTNENIMELFKNRYTCKGYDPNKKVSDEDFLTILEAGRLSPSSMGFEPWKFILMKNREILEKIKPYAWGAEHAIEGASHILLLLARQPEDMRPDSEYLKYIQNDVQNYPKNKLPERIERFRKFQNVDFDLVEDRHLFDWTSKQVFIPFTNMMTTAAMLDVDSTPIEGFNQNKLHEIFTENNVYDGKHFKIVLMLAFGYKNRGHREKTRRSLEEVFDIYE